MNMKYRKIQLMHCILCNCYHSYQPKSASVQYEYQHIYLRALFALQYLYKITLHVFKI